MYLSHHGAVGAGLAVAGYHIAGPVGVAAATPLAFGSHYILDWLGGRSYGRIGSRGWFIWEVLPILAIAVAAYISGIWWVFAVGFIAGVGNGSD